jgi:cyanophycinase-like exopeptidase
MAGTWMSIVEGFGGMRVKTINCTFAKNSKRMGRIFFKINFRNQIVTVSVSQENNFSVDGDNALEIVLNGTATTKSISSFSIKPARIIYSSKVAIKQSQFSWDCLLIPRCKKQLTNLKKYF